MPIGANAGQNLTEPKEKPPNGGVLPLAFYKASNRSCGGRRSEAAGSTAGLAFERLRRNFDAEVHLPADISRKFLSAALLWAVDNKVDFGLFHEASEIIIAHFGGDEIYLPSRWSDKRWHIGLEDKEPFDPSD
ncbi:hypothetical protein [Rhizobium leguminosarum]|uniref:Uncharacterized protein n=1 Tax=Rhizobium leguminosarum TaxID=384 RepID=A0A2K9ZHH2_RHILE|nr:hypothetical protein [Rhizobium leguminosarum]AUW47685.1 hypothetical protein CUJ84_pRLN3000578 [Rhizobium leguminosarum]